MKTVVADARRRVALPKPAQAGDVLAMESPSEGRFILTRLENPKPRVKLVRKQGFLVASTGRKISMAQTRALIDKFP